MHEFDPLVQDPKQPAKILSKALESLYEKGSVDPARARRYLAAALPRGPEYPKIFHDAARVHFALGDRDAVVRMVAEGRAHGGRVWLIRDDMALAPMWRHPGYAELFTGLEPATFDGVDAAIAAGPEHVVRLGGHVYDEDVPALRELVNVRRARIWWPGTGAVPAALAGLPRLEHVELTTMLGPEFPAAEMTALIGAPALEHLSVESEWGDIVRPGQIRTLRPSLAGLAPAVRQVHVALLFDPKGGLVGTADPRDLIAALDSPVAAIRLAARSGLAARLAAPALGSGDEILLTGRLAADRSALTERLSAAGITIGRRPGPATRLAVAGDLHRGKALAAFDAGVPVILEEQLPLPTGAGPATGDTTARLRELLRSPDPANVALAVTLARKNGLPGGLWEELIAVARDTALGRAVRSGAQGLLAEHAPATLREALAGPFARVRLFRPDLFHVDLAHAAFDLARAAPGTIDALTLIALLVARRPAGSNEGREFRVGAYDQLPDQRLPDALLTVADLRVLKLSLAELTELPEWIGRLTTLRELDLDINRLTTLPSSVGRLTALRSLTLSNNHLTELPAAVCELTGLTHLDLRVSRWQGGWPAYLTALPPDFGRLTGLRTLWVDGQPIGALPGSLRELPVLTHLSVRRSGFTELPAWLPELPALATFNAAENAVADTPANRDVVARLTARGVKVEVDLPEEDR